MDNTCPKCGEVNPKPGKFCRKCGGRMPLANDGTGGRFLPFLGLAVAILVVAAIFLGRKSTSTPSDPTPVTEKTDRVKLGIAYGTEKADWFKWAAAEFAQTPEGEGIELDLKPMGSLEAAQAIVGGDKSIHVWSPASALYKNVFLRDWEARYGAGSPIAKDAELALTPMVFVMWEERYNAFLKKYGEVSYRTIDQAMAEPEGWKTIASQPDWGFFKFSHTHPNRSNSGLMTLVLMAQDFQRRATPLQGRDVTDAGFNKSLATIEKNLVGAASPNDQLSPSTGTLMDWMVRRGPSTYDAIFVYESVAIDRLKAAEGRSGSLRVVYPKYNMWNANPYYILQTPSVTATHRKAADSFLAFLLSDRVQSRALVHGFRPANVQVATNGPDSPFVKFGAMGLQTQPPGMFCEMPQPEALENLLLGWQRIMAGR